MKKIITGCLMLCLWSVSDGWAQIVKGTKYWGTGISVWGSNSKTVDDDSDFDYKSKQVSVSPSLLYGRFYKDNRLFGVAVSTTFSNYSFETDNKRSQNTIQVGLAPFLRQYKVLGKRWFLFLQESVPLGYSFYKYDQDAEPNKDHGFNAGINVAPGISFKISDRFLIESDINLLSFGVSYSDQPHAKSFAFNSAFTTGLQSSFGIRAAWFLSAQEK